MNPAQQLLRWFDTTHLDLDKAAIVRKLIEAKDCAVRDYIEGRESQ